MAIFSGLGKIAGGVIARQGANKAAGGIDAATDKGLEYLEPYRDIGTDKALPWMDDTFFGDGQEDAPLHGGLGRDRINAEENPFALDKLGKDYEKSPGFDFRMEQGLNALDNSASAKGGLLSGANIKGRERYAQGVAAEDYWNYINQKKDSMMKDYGQRSDAWNRGFGISNMGFGAANNSANIGMRGAAQAGSLRAKGAAAFGQGVSGALGSIGSLFKPGGNRIGGNFGSIAS